VINIERKKITVLGAGESGLQSAIFLKKKNANVFLSELKKKDGFEETIKCLTEYQIPFEFGSHDWERISTSEFVVISPGIPPPAPICMKLVEAGIPIWSEIELAYRFCRGKMIAVTGTSGKTTVTTLITRVLNAGGFSAVSCGNIGNSFIREVGQMTPDTVAVIEISSFQLTYVHQFCPYVAIILNVSANHYDWHENYESYLNAKWRMFEKQTADDYALINVENEDCVRKALSLKSQVLYFEGDLGQNPNFAVVEQVARLFHVDPKIVQGVLKNFSGLEHRMEEVGSFFGVRYINDSKSTTIASLKWALLRSGSEIVLIAGGRFKGGDFKELRKLVRDRVKFVVAIGEAKNLIHEAYADLVPVFMTGSFEDALRVARGAAKNGQTVLFSPACASFDMFKNYKDRGEQFKRIVKSWQPLTTDKKLMEVRDSP